MRILCEQEGQRSGTGAGQAEPEQRRIDGDVVDLWVAAVPVLHLQPLTEMHADAGVDESLAPVVEPCLVAQPLHEDFQPLAEGVVAEVLQTRSLDSRSHQFTR
jgi:hypothetical protein